MLDKGAFGANELANESKGGISVARVRNVDLVHQQARGCRGRALHKNLEFVNGAIDLVLAISRDVQMQGLVLGICRLRTRSFRVHKCSSRNYRRASLFIHLVKRIAVRHHITNFWTARIDVQFT